MIELGAPGQGLPYQAALVGRASKTGRGRMLGIAQPMELGEREGVKMRRHTRWLTRVGLGWVGSGRVVSPMASRFTHCTALFGFLQRRKFCASPAKGLGF